MADVLSTLPTPVTTTDGQVRVLVIDDERAICELIQDVLEEAGYSVKVGHSVPDGIQALADGPVDVLVTDIVLGGPSGSDLLREVKAQSPDTVVVMMTGFASVETVVDALKHGADDFLLKPFKTAELTAAIDRALLRHQERVELSRLRSLAVIRDLGAKLAEKRQIRDICEAVTQAAVAETRADRASLLLYDRQAGVLILESAISPHGFPLQPSHRIPREASLAWEAIDGLQPLHVNPQMGTGDRSPAVLRNPGWGGALVWPIVHQGHPVGVLNLLKVSPTGDFSRADREIVSVLANNAAVALTNAQRLLDLRDRLLQTVGALTDMLEARDAYTRGHSERVAMYAEALARDLGMDETAVETIRLGALLHDIGKVGIYDSLIRSSTTLSDDEWDHMKAHPEIGARLLRQLTDLDHVIPIVEHHHEKYDGTGYPHQLAADDIPLLARLVTICDAFDAMTSARSYNSPMTLDEAIAELQRGAGTHFDPALVSRFISLVPGIFDPSGVPIAPLFASSRLDY
jgi:putative nucleotidyltransferase with HDIG domain